ncbi:MAG: hypothetical protein ACLFN5_02135 [bacterium]
MKETFAYKKYLDSLLGLTMIGIIIVILLMSALYWLALRVFSQLVPAGTVQIWAVINFYSLLIGCALGVAVISLLLFALRNTRYLVEPFQKIQMFQQQEKSSLTAESDYLVVGFYRLLRARLILFILAGMGSSFLLLAALYLATIGFVYSSNLVSDEIFQQFLSILSYYGTLTFFTLVLSIILLLLVAQRKLREFLGISFDKLKKVNIEKTDFDFEKLCRQLDGVLIVSELSEEVGGSSGNE